MRSLLTPVLSLLLVSSGFAQIQNQPVDPKQMLQDLQGLKKTQTKVSTNLLANTIADFSNAASSDVAAVNFYLEAVRVTQYEGTKQAQTNFHDWKKKDGTKVNGEAIRTCLRYMVISLQRAAGGTDKQIFPILLSYVQDTSANLTDIWGDDLVKSSITDNVFAKWYDIGAQLSSIDSWENTPENIDGIYQTTLLPIMRKNHDQRVIEYWNDKISKETTAATNAAAGDFNLEHFNASRLPVLLWSRSEDMININMRDGGLSDMMAIIKKYPGHPSAGQWIDELKADLESALATGSNAATASAPAPAPQAPAPAPAPPAPAPAGSPGATPIAAPIAAVSAPDVSLPPPDSGPTPIPGSNGPSVPATLSH